MTIHWITQRFANGIVNAWHSYLPPTRGGLFALGAFDAAECVGVIIVSRPKARRLDDGLTAEVTRVATNGHPNAASALLGRARRVCLAMGFVRLISYTREGEAGTSYKAAGWKVVARTEPRPWAKSGHHPEWKGRETPRVATRADVLVGQPKLRWEVAL